MKRKFGFTLVEIMIVVAVIALLAAISIPNLMRSRINANEAAAQSMVKTIVGLANSYRAVNPTYPLTINSLILDVPPYMMSADAVSGGGLTEVFIRKQGYKFSIDGDANTFIVLAEPETVGTTGNRTFRSYPSGQIFLVDDKGGDVPLE